MNEPSNFVVMVRQFETPSEWPDNRVPRPEIAIVRELDISGAARISVKFLRGNKVQLTQAYDIDDLLVEVSSGNYTYPNPINDVNPKWPYGCDLSMNNTELCYVIYVLSNKNWQFSRRGAPITISPLAKLKGAYFESRRVNRQGLKDKGEVTQDNCIAAYIIADADAAFFGGNEYIDQINLHVDIKTGPANRAIYMPLVIDPDIRHPGGSGEP